MPFVETALVGADEEGDSISHFAAIRYRVDGTGVLRSTLYGYNKVKSRTISPVTMVDPAYKELTRLTNFSSERALLRVETTGIDEVMRVNRIIIFLKSLYTSYPG